MSMEDSDNFMEPVDELELYVLDLLDDDERQALEARIASNTALQERVRELRGSLGALALGLEPIEPPAGLRDRILDQARSDVAPEEPLQFPATRKEPVSLWARWSWAAAALMAISIIAAVAFAADSGQPGELHHFPVVAVEASGDPSAGEITVRGGADQAQLILTGLAPAPENQVYQVWLVAGDDPPVPNITFVPREDGRATLTIRGDLPASQLLAITLEPRGGSLAPTTDILFVSELTWPESG